MTAVLIHPTGVAPRSPDAAEHWDRTIVNTVDFRSGAVAAALTDWEREKLEEFHPDGRARFWGAHRRHQAQLGRIAEDEVVVLTGNGKILGLGRAGLVTTNAALGDALWPHRHPVFGSYRHLYSLAEFSPTDLPLTGLRDAGVSWFQTPLFIDDARADEILVALGPATPSVPTAPTRSPVERALREARNYDDADAALAADLNWVRELQIEVRSTGDSHVRARAAATMHRGENLLVHDYVQSLPSGVRWCRFDTLVGVTDLDVWENGEHHLVEAKSSAARSHIRQALAQLLDYAPSLHEDLPDVLTVLVPSRPSDSAVALLHRYGVGCVFRREDGLYERLAAPAGPAAAIAALWPASAQDRRGRDARSDSERF